MSFIIEYTKNGKPNIVFLNHKYRESYSSAKSGEITWRCLGSKCRASVKTDENKTNIVSTNNKHSGPHPVTMRTLTPLTTSTPSRPPTPAPSTSSAPVSDTDTPRTSTPSTPPPDDTLAPTPTSELEQENWQLRSKINSLNEEIQHLLEHTIESDSRLLQYTDKIFVANTPTNDTQHMFNDYCELQKALTEKISNIKELEQTVESHAKISREYEILKEESGKMIASLRSLEHDNKVLKSTLEDRDRSFAVRMQEKDQELAELYEANAYLANELREALHQEEKDNESLLDYHRRYAQDSFRCLSKRLHQSNYNLKEKIENLHKENGKLRLQINIKNDQTKSNLPCKQPTPAVIPIPLHNSFAPLESTDDEEDLGGYVTVYGKRNKKRRKKKTKNVKIGRKENKKKGLKCPHSNVPMHQAKLTLLPFKSVTVLGDSHARHIAPLMHKITQRSTHISGVCKPNAGLKEIVVTSARPPAPSHCDVLMLGTNDVDAGRQSIIFSQLENVIGSSCSASSRVLLVPLFPRHDLPPDTNIRRVTSLVNNYMEELCIRHEGAEILDISTITRHHFTRQGLHLQDSGKELLSELLVQKLAGMKPTAVNCPPRSSQPAPAVESSPGPLASPGPFTLPHESFAAAVIHSPTKMSTEQRQCATYRPPACVTPPKTLIPGGDLCDMLNSKNKIAMPVLHVM